MRTCLNITFSTSGNHYIIATAFIWLNLRSESKNNKNDTSLLIIRHVELELKSITITVGKLRINDYGI